MDIEFDFNTIEKRVLSQLNPEQVQQNSSLSIVPTAILKQKREELKNLVFINQYGLRPVTHMPGIILGAINNELRRRGEL